MNINRLDVFGMTPLMRACRDHDTGALRRLLEHGADVDAATNLGKTALHCCRSRM